jgi:hypothetical protein
MYRGTVRESTAAGEFADSILSVGNPISGVLSTETARFWLARLSPPIQDEKNHEEHSDSSYRAP